MFAHYNCATLPSFGIAPACREFIGGPALGLYFLVLKMLVVAFFGMALAATPCMAANFLTSGMYSEVKVSVSGPIILLSRLPPNTFPL